MPAMRLWWRQQSQAGNWPFESQLLLQPALPSVLAGQPAKTYDDNLSKAGPAEPLQIQTHCLN